jgi:hypothetical protein
MPCMISANTIAAANHELEVISGMDRKSTFVARVVTAILWAAFWVYLGQTSYPKGDISMWVVVSAITLFGAWVFLTQPLE